MRSGLYCKGYVRRVFTMPVNVLLTKEGMFYIINRLDQFNSVDKLIVKK